MIVANTHYALEIVAQVVSALDALLDKRERGDLVHLLAFLPRYHGRVVRHVVVEYPAIRGEDVLFGEDATSRCVLGSAATTPAVVHVAHEEEADHLEQHDDGERLHAALKRANRHDVNVSVVNMCVDRCGGRTIAIVDVAKL